ncbi:MAG: LysE family transporter [Cyclobacteriaceae bacterium]
MAPVVNGLLFGLVFVLALGPAFFALIQTSVHKGFKPAVFFALGISLSDVLYVGLILLGISGLFNNPEVKFWMGVIGTIVLLIVGVSYWFKPVHIVHNKEDMGSKAILAKYILKGLLLNGLNPFIIVFWVSAVSLVNLNYEYTFYQKTYFFIGVLVTILTTDIVKASLAQRLKQFITPEIVLRANRIVGSLFIIFSLRIVYFLIVNYWE